MVARRTVVTLTGTCGERGGSFFEHAAMPAMAITAMHVARIRVLIWNLELEVDATTCREKKRRACRRVHLVHQRRGRVAPVKCTTPTLIGHAEPAHWREQFVPSRGRGCFRRLPYTALPLPGLTVRRSGAGRLLW